MGAMGNVTLTLSFGRDATGLPEEMPPRRAHVLFYEVETG